METEANVLQAIFDHAALGIAQISLDGSWLRVNHRYCQMLGYSEAEMLRKTLADITHPDHIDESLAGRRQLVAGEISSHTMDKRYVRSDGTVFWGRLNRSLVRDQDNQPQYIIAVVEDITEKSQAEQSLRDAERRLVLAQNAAHLGIWDRDLSKNVIITSGNYNSLYGLAPDHPPLTCDEWLDLVHPDDRQRVENLLRDAHQQIRAWDTEFRVVWPDGSVHWLLGKGTVFLDESGRRARFMGVNLDITERKRAEEVLRESEERFRDLADTVPVMIWVAGPNKGLTFLNKTWLNFVGRPEEQVLDNGWTESVHPDDLDDCVASYFAAFDARRNFEVEERLRRADGEYRTVLCTGIPRYARDGAFAGYIGSTMDITDLRRTQQKALERQKLESLGVLAGGIAHDFNNLLGGILAEAELGQADLSTGWSPVKELHRIKEGAIRGAEIVRQLMTYSGQDKAGPVESVDLSRLVEEMLELLKISASKHAVLKVNLQKKLPAVSANSAQLRQVVMNLVINASEAIGEKEGLIIVTTSHIVLPQGSGPHLPSGDYLKLEVSDTGCGMTQEMQAKIFDPFFSTKFAGRGLGLAVVQGIVRDHGGAITLVSALGRGTKFEIFLPSVGESAQLSHGAIAQAPSREHHPRVGTVLVVEDEGVLRVAVSRMLQKDGFRVIEAGDGSSALELVRAHKDQIDVMLLDITLPGVSSREVFEQAQRLRPNIKVILTSAYGREAVNASFEGLRVDRFIRKPFQFVDLMDLLQDALSA